MNILKKKGALLLLSISLMSAASSCHSDDPGIDDVTPPVVTEVNNISGSVAAMDGKPIEGATVTMSGTASGTATTDSNGYFIFDNVKSGDYKLEVSAPGKFSKSTNVTVAKENASNVVWNVMLASESSVTEITVTPDAQSDDEVKTEALEGNDHAEVPIEIEVPANSVNKSATITMQPIYDSAEAEALTKAVRAADESTMLVGARLSCDDSSVVIENPLILTFNVDEETASSITGKKYVNGRWVDVPFRTEGGKVIVEADEFTSYGVFLGVSFTSTGRNVDIVFEQSEWDNLYGRASLDIGDVSYDYKVGTKIETMGTNVLTALLVETLARRFGANAYDAKGSYPVNITLPIGTAFSLSGTQQVNTVTASARNRSVTATQYGTVTVITKTWNRNHTGGSGGGMQ